MNTVIQSLKECLITTLNYLYILDKEARSKNLQNEQWFIDWQDKLNALSVK